MRVSSFILVSVILFIKSFCLFYRTYSGSDQLKQELVLVLVLSDVETAAASSCFQLSTQMIPVWTALNLIQNWSLSRSEPDPGPEQSDSRWFWLFQFSTRTVVCTVTVLDRVWSGAGASAASLCGINHFLSADWICNCWSITCNQFCQWFSAPLIHFIHFYWCFQTLINCQKTLICLVLWADLPGWSHIGVAVTSSGNRGLTPVWPQFDLSLTSAWPLLGFKTWVRWDGSSMSCFYIHKSGNRCVRVGHMMSSDRTGSG